MTVAVRGAFEISAISPKKSPGPIILPICLPPCVTSAVPSIRTKNSRPVSPSLISVLPAGRSTSSAIAAISASSDFEAPENRGTPLIRSIFELSPSFNGRSYYAARERTKCARSALAPGTEPAAPAGHQVRAREPGPLAVRLQQFRGLVQLDPAAAEGGAQLDEAEIADEPMAPAAEPFAARRLRATMARGRARGGAAPRPPRSAGRAGPRDRSCGRRGRASRRVRSPARAGGAAPATGSRSTPASARARRTRERSPARSASAPRLDQLAADRAEERPRHGRRPQRAQAVQVPKRRAEQRVVTEAAAELGRVGVEGEHEAQQLEPLLVRCPQQHVSVRALPGLAAPAARQRRLERAAVGHQVQAVGPGRSDDVFDHRLAPYCSLQMRLTDAISLRSRRRKFALFMQTMAPTAETTVLDVGVDDSAFGERGALRDAQLLRGALPLAGADHGARLARRDAVPGELSERALRPGRRPRPAFRRRRVRPRLLERRDRARRRP